MPASQDRPKDSILHAILLCMAPVHIKQPINVSYRSCVAIRGTQQIYADRRQFGGADGVGCGVSDVFGCLIHSPQLK